MISALSATRLTITLYFLPFGISPIPRKFLPNPGRDLWLCQVLLKYLSQFIRRSGFAILGKALTSWFSQVSQFTEI
jgi:hypothetical protein